VIRIAPFQPLGYSPSGVSFISRVIAPPYDVIDAVDAEKLRERDRHNIIRLILGKPGPHGHSPAQYEHAALTLDRWRAEGVITCQEEPAIFVYEQQFKVNGQTVERMGVMCALLLPEEGEVGARPHEHTMSGPKADRYELMKACRAALSQVFTIHSDADGAADALAHEMAAGEPLHQFCDQDATIHKMWVVTDPSQIARFAASIAGETMFIADGHHRYETALRYREEHRAGGPNGSCPEDFVIVFSVSVRNSGLKVLPTHRLVKKEGEFDKQAFVDAIKPHFDIGMQQVPGAKELAAAFEPHQEKGDRIGCYLRDRTLLVLRAKAGTNRPSEQLVDPLQVLPVAQLHHDILGPHFAVPSDIKGQHDRLMFTQNVEDMYWAVESSRYDAAFLLPPPSPEHVLRVAEAGERMPPKSTFFYPKVASGLIIYPFEKVPKL